MEEQLPDPKRRKIQGIVLDILKTADIETATEYSVRTTAAQQLGTEILNIQEKNYIRHVVESFLLSTVEKPTLDNNRRISTAEKETNKDFVAEEQLSADHPPTQQQEADGSLPNPHFVDSNENNCRTICKLSGKRSVGILDIHGKPFVAIRDFYEKDGKLVPSSRGINLSAQQWSSFRSSFPAIVEAIATMESKIRLTTSENQTAAEVAANGREQIQTNISQSVNHQEGKITADRKENGDDVCNSAIITNSQVQMPLERQQTEAGISNSAPCFAPQGQIQQSSRTTSLAQSLVPVKTIRLDGTNYYCWKHQIEFFLKQLNIAYVLSEPCPNTLENRQKWVDDDYLCCRNISNSLSDKLFEEYSKKNYSAKELWEELRSTYDEDFGTKSSEVNKYLQFQMVDGISILEQVQELHKIADSLMASGIWIDENFHISAIIAKLPPSWKDCRARLMHENVLSLDMLMHHLRVEEDCRNRYKNDKLEKRVGARKKDLTKKQCYNCGKEGHISKYCTERNYQVFEKSNGKESETIPVITEGKINGQCYNCGKEGHISKYCTERNYQVFEKSNGKESETIPVITEGKINGQCYNCGKEGHISKYCTERNYQVLEKSNGKESETIPVTEAKINGQCYSCGKEGHISKYCTERNYQVLEKSNGKESETIPVVTEDKINGQCYNCGKEGHISKYCTERNYQVLEKSNGKESETIPVVTEAKISRQCYNCGKERHISKYCTERNYQVCEKSNGRESETIHVVAEAKINGKTDGLVAIVSGVKSNGKSDKISPMAEGP
ncbi:uncharacterized protein LOC107784729 [Nicotiana tabacum]|uniref:uncharacterized protein LOC107784729 n=1 Tax=Nicotiana tabacum TaxID=4097 RepID=UPI003F4E8549